MKLKKGINSRIDEASEIAKKLREIENNTNLIKEKLLFLNYEDLIISDKYINGNEEVFIVSLPNTFKERLQKFSLLPQEYPNYKKALNFALWGEEYEPYKELDWKIKINVDHDNRIHFDGGIPKNLRRIGLGLKVYKKVITEYGYISTIEHESSGYINLMWLKILEDDQFSKIYSPNTIVACMADHIPENLMRTFNNITGAWDRGKLQISEGLCKKFKKK